MRYCCRRVTISVLLAASAVFGSVTGDESNEELRQLELRQREKSLFDEIHRDLHHMSMTPPPADPETVPRHQWESVSWKGKSGKKHHRNKHHKHSPKHSSPKKSKMKSSKKHGKGASSSYSKGYFSKGKGTGPIGKGTGVLPTPQPQPTMSPKPTEYGPTTSPGTPSRPTAPYSQPPVEPSTGMPSSVGGPTANTPPPYDGISYIPTNPPSSPGSGSATVDLSPFVLLYTIDQFRLPLPSEFETVGDLTKAFVDNYFGTIYPTTLLSAETELVDANFNFGAPVDMLYNTTLVFSPGSEFPPEDQLNAELEAAFTGDSMASYLAIIQGLPPSNIFETTSLIEFQRPAPPSPLFGNSDRDASTSVSSSSTGEVKSFFSNPIVQYTGIAVAASAACFVIIVTGLLLQDKRTTSNSRKQGEGGNKNGAREGPTSVTGHTVELRSSSNDSRSTTPLTLGHHQRNITMPQHQHLNQLGSMDSTLSQGEWEEIVQSRHHTGSVGARDDDDDDDEADDDAGHLTKNQLLHDVNLSSA